MRNYKIYFSRFYLLYPPKYILCFIFFKYVHFFVHQYYNTSPDQLQDLHCIKMLDSDDEKAVKKRLSCYQSKISYCIENFGIFCAHEVIMISDHSNFSL